MSTTSALESFPETARILEEDVDEGYFTKGAQIAVEVDGRPALSLALGDDGRGNPVQLDTVFRVYCTIKPVTALAVARLVDDGILELDAPLDRHLDDFAALSDGEVALRHVLAHTAGLHRPMAIELELMPPDKRPGFLRTVERPIGWKVGAQAGYSEWFGWHVLGCLIERVTGEPLRDHLRTSVIEPLGLTDTWIGMTDDEYRATVGRIGLNHDMRLLQPYPLLLERGRRMCTEVNPAHGGYSTATDLSRLYGAIVGQLTGAGDDRLASAETLRRFTRSARPPLYDRVLDRECAYGLGFMTELHGHAFGASPSEQAFGHSGNVGSSFAWGDPAVGLAAAVVYNGVVDPESALLRRPSLVRAVHDDLAHRCLLDDAEAGAAEEASGGGATGAGGGPGSDPEPPPRRRFGRRSR